MSRKNVAIGQYISVVEVLADDENVSVSALATS
jgi:hypothetical protein